MLQALIPPGRHVITLDYWPEAFSAGIGLAVAAVVGLGSALVWERVRRRRERGGRPTVPT
jgi:hypothetical protein